MRKYILGGVITILTSLSFSYAVNRVNDIGAYEDLGEGNLCTINEDLSFDCSESNNIIVGQNTSNWNPSSTSYFWTSSGLAFYHFYYNNTSNNRQGYVDSFKFCLDASCSNYDNLQSLTIDEFLEYVENNVLVSWEWYSTSSNRGIAGLKFYFSGGVSLYTNPTVFSNYTSYNFNLIGYGLQANYSNLGVINSPLTQEQGGGTPFNPIGNEYLCPTIQQLINTYPTQYNTGLCYSSNLIIENGQIQTVTPKTIFELYPTYTGFTYDINLYNNYCNTPNTTASCETAFTGKTEEYTLITKIPNDIRNANLYQYCHLQLDYQDKNATTCIYSGVVQTGGNSIGNIPISNEDIINSIVNDDISIVLPGGIENSGSTISGNSIYTDIIDLENQTARDILDSLNNIYTKITGIFTKRGNVNGLIPEYIVRLICLIVLYKLRKK